MKLSEKLESILASEKEKPTKKTWYSFEYFPPKTEQGIENLMDRIDRMATYNPLWVDMTWNAGGSSSDLTLSLCTHIQQYTGLDVLMHLTCTNMEKRKIDEALEGAYKAGIRNILALRGDPPRGQEKWTACEGGFEYSTDLIKYIKSKYDDYFCIVAAGYPETHLEAQSRAADLCHLKEKVAAGAEIIIT